MDNESYPKNKLRSGNSTIDKCKGKVCKETQICNPKSGRCVSKRKNRQGTTEKKRNFS